VLNSDDPVVYGYAEAARPRVITYRRGQPASGGVGVEDGWIVSAGVRRLESRLEEWPKRARAGSFLPSPNLALPGEHNVSNALAAVATALLFGVAPDAVRAAAGGFAGVEHRSSKLRSSTVSDLSTTRRGTQPMRDSGAAFLPAAAGL